MTSDCVCQQSVIGHDDMHSKLVGVICLINSVYEFTKALRNRSVCRLTFDENVVISHREMITENVN